MNSKEFKTSFDTIATKNGFVKEFGGWFKESKECISVLSLQKSMYGDYYQLMIKIFVRGLFDNLYPKSKILLKDTGDVFRSEPPEYKNIFNVEVKMADAERWSGLEDLFDKFIVPFINDSLSREGLKKLAKQGVINLLPAIKDELEKPY